MNTRDPVPPSGQPYVMAPLNCACGTLGRRLPDLMPEMIVVVPDVSVVVNVDCSFASLSPAENARSRSAGEHSGVLSGSLMPPSRKPLETCAFNVKLSDAL